MTERSDRPGKGRAATDFFGRQEDARRAARRLVVLYVVSVIAVVGMLLGPLCLIKAAFVHVLGLDRIYGITPFPHVLTLCVLGSGLVALMVWVSWVRIRELRDGGWVVMRSIGAIPIDADSTDLYHRRLLNVVQEMAIAAAVPVPDLYLLQRESSINAFVAGHGPADAALCVTRGCLDRLNRDELQGIVAHEFSHIVHGDMRLNIRLTGLFAGVFFMASTGRSMMSDAAFSGIGIFTILAGSVMFLVGSLGHFLGQLTQAWISRSREYLADAAAIQYTRQQLGLAGALKKTLALGEGSFLLGFDPTEIAHMLFGRGRRQQPLLASHPTVPARIQALGMEYNEHDIAGIVKAWQEPAQRTEMGVAAIATATPARAVTAPAAAPAASVAASTAIPAVGQVDDTALAHASRSLQSLPEIWISAAQSTEDAPAMILAFTLSARYGQFQFERIQAQFDAATSKRVATLFQAGGEIPRHAQLPLLILALPSLRKTHSIKLEKMRLVLMDWTREDGRIDMHEYCLLYLFRMYTREALHPAGTRIAGAARLYDCRVQFGLLCALMAQQGGIDDARARAVWQVVMDRAIPGHDVTYAAPTIWQTTLDSLLSILDELRPDHKKLVIDGLSAIVLVDRKVTLEEAELLRLVCACMHCPLPPFVNSARVG